MSIYQKILIVCFALALSSCATTPVLNVKGDISREIKQKAPAVGRVDISPDGRYVLSAGMDSFILWDILQGKKMQTFSHDGFMTWPIAIAFSPDGKYFASGGKGTKLWDFVTRQEIRTFDEGIGASINFSPDGKYFIRGGPPSNLASPFGTKIPTMKIFDVATGRGIRDFKLQNFVQSVVYSPDGKHVLTGDSEGQMDLWDTLSGKSVRKAVVIEKKFLDPPRSVWSVSFSSDGEYTLSGGQDNSVILWNAKNFTEIKKFIGHTGMNGISSVVFSPDGKYALSAGSDSKLKIWDLASGTERRVLVGHTGLGASAKFSPNGKYVISAGDASTRIWDVSTGEEVASMIAFENGEWLFITPEGYYNASEHGAQYWDARIGDKSYSVDQFYDVFYRPDIVAAKMSGQDISGLISITMKDAIKSPPPLVEFTTQPTATDPEKMKVCYRIKSSGGGIGEVRLFHNGKLIQSDGYYKDIAKSTNDKTQLAALSSKAIYEDMRSIVVKGHVDTVPISVKLKGDVFEDCQNVEAIPGENEVSVTAFNRSNTVQSYMKTVSFNSKIKQEEPNLYILAIGIDQYKDASVKLKYAVKDARDIEEKIKVQAETLYNPRNIHYELLTDGEANKKNIINKINELANTIKPQDSFILFVAGHGVLLQNQYYMLTYDFNGRVSDTNMISSNEIVEMSKKIKSLSQLLIFDTCHAGGVDTIVSGLYDARISVLAKKMGLHIYASASDKQSAMDGYKGNGLFTYTLLDGLNNNKKADKNKDGKVTVVGLGEYSQKMTSNLSKEIGYPQNPLIINFGKDSPLYKLR
ncbi:MAG: caspase family protein [Syntrophus sp. (in: bacteria)]